MVRRGGKSGSNALDRQPLWFQQWFKSPQALAFRLSRACPSQATIPLDRVAPDLRDLRVPKTLRYLLFRIGAFRKSSIRGVIEMACPAGRVCPDCRAWLIGTDRGCHASLADPARDGYDG
jgi:hypothetical protein